MGKRDRVYTASGIQETANGTLLPSMGLPAVSDKRSRRFSDVQAGGTEAASVRNRRQNRFSNEQVAGYSPEDWKRNVAESAPTEPEKPTLPQRDALDTARRESFRQRQEDPAEQLHILENTLAVRQKQVEDLNRQLQETPVDRYQGWWVETKTPRQKLVEERDAAQQDRFALEEQIREKKKELYVIPGAPEARMGEYDSVRGQARSLTDSASLLQQIYTSVNGVLQMEQQEDIDTQEASVRVKQAQNTLRQIRSNVEYAQRYFQKQGDAVSQTGANEMTTQLLSVVDELQTALEEADGWLVGKLDNKAKEDSNWLWYHLSTLLDKTALGIFQFGDNLLQFGDMIASPFTEEPLFQDVHESVNQERERLENILQYAGGLEQGLNTLAEVTGGALPAAAAAVMTGGTSMAGTSANAIGGTSAALYGTAATGSLGQAIGTSASSLASNPNFWLSVLPVTGSTYAQAKEEGASDWEAAATAVLNGILSGAIEVGEMNVLPDSVSRWLSGGIQSLPNSTRGLLDWVRSSVAEGNEEVLQSMVQNALSKFVYDRGRPVFSTTDETAIVNPVRAGEELAVGAAVGGLLGLPQLNPASVVREIRTMSEVSRLGAQVRQLGTLDPLLEAANAEMASPRSRLLADEIQAQQERGVQPTDAQIGTLGLSLLSDESAAGNVSVPGASQGTAQAVSSPSSAPVNQTTDFSKMAREVGNATGRRIELVDSLDNGMNGAYDPQTGILYLSTNTRQPLLTVLGHELTHSIENASLYERLARYVQSSIAFENALSSLHTDLDTLIDATVGQYAEHGITLDRESALREIYADYIADTFFQDEAAVRQLVQTDRSLAQRIRDFIRRIRTRLTGTAEQVELLRIEQLYRKALRESEAATSTGDMAASIQMDSNRKPYVQVDTDQHLFDDVPENEYPKIAEGYIRSRFKGKILPVAQDSAYVNGLSAREYGHPANRRIASEVKNAKMRASTELDNLLAVSEYIGHASDDGRHKQATGGWDNYRTTFALDGHLFEGIVRVMNTDRGRLFYDIGQIKEISRNVGQTEPVSAAASGDLDKSVSREAGAGTGPASHEETFSDTSLPQGENGVNTSIRENASGMQETVSNAFHAAPDTDAPERQNDAKRGFAQGESDTRASIGQGDILREWAERLQRYGPVRPEVEADRQVPAQIDENTRVSRGIGTAMGYSPLVTDEAVPAIQEAVLSGRGTYTAVSDAEALRQARAIIRTKGAESARRSFEEKLIADRRITKTDIAVAELLVQEALSRGEYDTAAQLLGDASVAASQAGQTAQAVALLRKLTPEGRLQTLQRNLDKMNDQFLYRENRATKHAQEILENKEQIANLEDQVHEGTLDRDSAMQRITQLQKEIARLGGGLELSQLQKELILSQTDNAGMEQAVQQVSQQIAQAVPVTGVEKYNAWRFFSMLANPTTHIRNMLGNTSMGLTVMAKDIAAATMEAAADTVAKVVGKDGITRTKSLRAFSPRERARYHDLVEQQYLRLREDLQGDKKAGYLNKFLDDRKIFGDTKLEDVRKFAMDLLEREDGLFLKAHYREAMYQYLTANRVDPNTVSEAQLQRANDYAIQEAQKATFRDASALASWLNRVSRKNKAAEIVIEGNLPFKKTPINILKRGVEYSPLGLVNTVKNAVNMARGKEGYNAARFIDSLASTFTGSALTAIGAWLASQGILTGLLGDDKEDDFKILQGQQSYALNIGDTSYTIDWLSPDAMPLFVGVEIWNALQEKDEGLTFADATEALSHMLEPMTQMSMLQGLSGTLDSISNSDNKLTAFLSESLTSYLLQMLPTLGGKIGNIIDDTRRQAYIDKNSPLPSDMQYALQQTMKKIPGASTALQPYINEWGEEETEESVLTRILESLISPGYASKLDSSEMEQELQRLYDATGETGVLPSRPQKYFTVSGQRVDLTGDAYTQLAKVRGSTQKDILTQLVESDLYLAMDDENRVKAVQRVYDYAAEVAKAEVAEVELSEFAQNAKNAKQKYGLSTAEYILFTQQKSGKKQPEVVKIIDGLPISSKDKDRLYTDIYAESTLDKNSIW